MTRLESILAHEEIPSYITPLFWQHGEDEYTLRYEIQKMCENGIGSFIVESRPHPDFLGSKWWQDLDIIIDEAKKLNMKVWIFDDSAYPSGYCAGKLAETHPEYLKIYLKEQHFDAAGPLKGSSFLINAWLSSGEELVRVIAARRTDMQEAIDAKSLVDVTHGITDGIQYWDLPEGAWRIFVISSTRNGGEEHTKNYLNPLDRQAVGAFIEIVHEAHYNRYAKEFGSTIIGFFTDEPRFGNAASYAATLGKLPMVLPYSKDLIALLNEEWDGDYGRLLPCLWYDGGEKTADIRYTFMNLVSKLYSENFSVQIGDWCRNHDVKLIGHVVEDNGAHARLGYGAGHFFRAILGQDYSGLDVVYNIWPQFDSGSFSTPFFNCNAEFNYWGITKMASSAGHIDPKKNGITVCEVFGAYGWQEGLKLMKWLTDHICVRGVNFLIPHAFSPKFPDNDCPPHFYARGHNPQWRYFNIWSSYTNRLCHLLTGGVHIAPAAVLYHAEAEWGGAYEPFEMVVKQLTKNQIDCDIIPIDIFTDSLALTIHSGYFSVNNENYKILLIPYAEHIPAAFCRVLNRMADHGVKIIFMTDYPTDNYYDSADQHLNDLKCHSNTNQTTYADLIPYIRSLDVADIQLSEYQDSIRYYHYVNDARDIYFFTNESKFQTVSTTVRFNKKGHVVSYDAMSDEVYSLSYNNEDGSTNVEIIIEPYDSLFVIFCTDDELISFHSKPKLYKKDLSDEYILQSVWKVSTATAEEFPRFTQSENIDMLCNISTPDLLPRFSGTIQYETDFLIERNKIHSRTLLDLGDVYEIAQVNLNGNDLGTCICPPYNFDITGLLKDGKNEIKILVTNTLAKQMPNEWLDKYMPQEPSGLLGPVRIMY